MTLLSIAQQICNEVGVTAPSTIISNNNQTAKRLLAILQTSGRTLASGKITLPNGYTTQHDWTALITEQTFNTSNGTATYALSGSGSIITNTDFDRFVYRTMWDRTNYNEILLFSPEQWQISKSGGITASSVNKRARKRGRFLVIDPTPSATESLVFEYVSSKWCQSSGGTAQTAWTADTDTGILDEELFIADGKWRFLKAIGEAYAEEQKEAMEAIALKAGADITPQSVNFAGRDREYMDGNHGAYNCIV